MPFTDILGELTLPAIMLAAFLLYHLLPQRYRNAALLTMSYALYAAMSWRFALILLCLTGVTYRLGRSLQQGRYRKLRLTVGISVNLLVWLSLKGGKELGPQLALLLRQFGVETLRGVAPWLLPIGLSFYMLQAIAYLIEIYRRQLPPARPFIDFALYLVFFPKLTAGPIERPKPFLEQLAHPAVVDNKLAAESFGLIVLGLFRKIVIADTILGVIPPNAFSGPANGGVAVVWLILFGAAIYNDFCGYTCMVRGISGLFGIRLSRNFNTPFFAASFSDFWNRWHISLSHYLRDYIYSPMSRALLRRNPTRTNVANLLLPPLATMLASGIWHGFGLNFVIWGTYCGVLLIGERLWKLWQPPQPRQKRPVWKWAAAVVLVQVTAIIGLTFFVSNAADLPHLWRAILMTDWDMPEIRVHYLLLLSIGLDLVQLRLKEELPYLRLSLLPRAAILATAVLLILLFAGRPPQPFVYQAF